MKQVWRYWWWAPREQLQWEAPGALEWNLGWFPACPAVSSDVGLIPPHLMVRDIRSSLGRSLEEHQPTRPSRAGCKSSRQLPFYPIHSQGEGWLWGRNQSSMAGLGHWLRTGPSWDVATSLSRSTSNGNWLGLRRILPKKRGNWQAHNGEPL